MSEQNKPVDTLTESENTLNSVQKPLPHLHEFRWQNLIMLVFSTLINTAGVGFFLVAAKLLDGGFSGTAILFNFITTQTSFYQNLGLPAISISLFLLVLNIPLFIFGAKKLGLNFVIYSVFAICFYSFWMYVLSSVAIKPENVLLSAVFGGLLSGTGSGLTIRYGGCLDGVEVMAVWLNRKTGLSVGTLVMMYNAVIMSASIPLVGVDNALYSIIAYAVGLKAVDFMVEGLDRGKAAMIITDKGEEVADILSKEMGRGVTLWLVTGFYTQQQKSALYFVVNRFEVVQLKELVYYVDPAAFVSFNEVSEVLGESGAKKRFSKI